MLYQLLNFKTIGDLNGSLIAIENKRTIPFEIKRVYYIFDTAHDVVRGKHAHKRLEQVIIPLAGSCDFFLDNGNEKEKVHLASPNIGLYIKHDIWREFTHFSSGCILLVLASEHYTELDYIRNYNDFLTYRENKNFEKSIYIHNLADVQSQNIGEGTRIWQFCVVLPQAQIGNNCNICSHCFVENNVVIGNNVTIKCNTQIWDGMIVEDNVFIGPNVSFCNDKYPNSQKRLDAEYIFTPVPVYIKRNASIGAGAVILPGVTIGEYAKIGAGAIVTSNVPDNAVVVGYSGQHEMCRS